MDTEKIRIEDDTMEEIRKTAAETGETPEEIAARFEEFLGELSSRVPDEVREWRRTIDYHTNKKKLKEAV
jgi:hypothetical protein